MDGKLKIVNWIQHRYLFYRQTIGVYKVSYSLMWKFSVIFTLNTQNRIGCDRLVGNNMTSHHPKGSANGGKGDLEITTTQT